MKKIHTRLIIIIFLVITSLLVRAQTFKPPQISGLKLWLRADSLVTPNITTASAWGDCSGNAYNSSQATAANQPTIVNSVTLLNGKPALYFDGTNDVLNGSTITGIETTSVTIFIVASGEALSSSGYYCIFGINLNTNGFWVSRYHTGTSLRFSNNNNSVSSSGGSLPAAGFDPKILCVVKNYGGTGPVQLFLNGTQNGTLSSTGIAGTFTNAIYKIGYGGTFSYYKGNIAEIIIYNSALSATDRQKVEAYLQTKYAPPVNLGPDINMAPRLCDTVLDAGARFIHYNWSTGDTTRTITVSKTGQYSVAATNVFGAISRDTINVSYPSRNLNTTTATVCLGDSIALKPQTGHLGNYTLQWSPGGNTDSIKYAKAPGKYWVKIIDSQSCFKYSDTATIVIDSLKNHFSVGPDTTMCAGGNIQTYHPGYTIVSYLWKGGATTSTIAVYNAGTYWAQGIDNHGCSATDSLLVNISGYVPLALFTADSACLGSGTHFTDQSTVNGDSIVQWNWNFGDGDTSILKNPIHTYAVTGTYTVSLKVTTSGGCFQTTTKQVYVYPVPTAHFSTSTACNNVAYQFTDQSSIGSGGTISVWNWNFGDGHTSSIQNPSNTYVTASVYSVALKVTSNHGCQDSNSQTITVVSSSPVPQPFTLSSPTDFTSLGQSTVTFVWNASINATVYKLQVADDSLFSINVQNFINIYGTTFTTSLAGNHNYFWRVLAYNPCMNSAITAFRHLRIFSPSNLSGLRLWLKADTLAGLNGTTVANWGDCSGGHNALQSTTANQPTYYSSVPKLNGKPAIYFDGTNDFLASQTAPLDSIPNIGKSSMTIFIVSGGDSISSVIPGLFSINTTTSGFVWIRHGSNKSLANYNKNLSFNGTPNSLTNLSYSPKILCFVKILDTSSTMYINSIACGTSTNATITSAFTNTGYRLGNYSGGSAYYKGTFAEILVYNSALNATNRALVENYIKNKYAPPVNLGPDIVKSNFCTTTLDAGARFVSYLWSPGNLNTQTISVTKSGTYIVQATSTFGTISRDTINVTFADSRLNHSDTTICQGSSFNVKPRCSPLSNYTFHWNTGSTDSVITVSQTGDYFVTITDGLSCTRISDTLTVSLDLFPSHVSLGNDTSMCSNHPIKVFHTGYPIQTYLWTGNSTADSLIVNNTGDYWVQATNNRGCIGRDTVHVTITGNSPLTRFITDTVCFGSVTHFTDSSFVQIPDSITQWNWNFGDGNTSVLKNPVYLYASPGAYSVNLTATTNAGCFNSSSGQVIVRIKPVAQFLTSTACVNNAYTFIDQSNTAPGSTISSWAWKFGDGGISTNQNPTHTYNNDTVFPVTLVVLTNHGCADTLMSPIIVVASSPPPQAINLISPYDFEISGQPTVTFSWNISTNASTYELQIANDSSFTQNLQTYSGITGTVHIVTLPSNQNYFWRVIAYNPCGNTTYSNFRHLRIFNPSNLIGLKLWLSADSLVSLNGVTVSSWADASGSGYNCSQATPANQPTKISSVTRLNGKPAIHFDGTNDVLNGSLINGIDSSSATIFIVASGDSLSATGYYTIFGINLNTNGFWLSRYNTTRGLRFSNNNNQVTSSQNSLPASRFDPKILCVSKKYITGPVQIYLNGVPDGTLSSAGIAGPFTNSIYKLGYGGTYNYYKGGIAEVILYNSELSTVDRKTVEEYLYNKYAPPVNLGPDIIKSNLCSTTIDAGGRFTHFLWSTGDTTQIISVNTSSAVSVAATNVFGQVSYDTIIISYPDRHLNTTSTNVCMGDSIGLKPQTGQLYKYSFTWHPTGSDSIIYVKTPGQYWVTIYDTLGCFVNSDTASVAIDSLKTHFSLGNDTSMCAGYILRPKHTGYTIPTYLWMDNSTDSTITVWTSGNYSVSVTDINGCQANDSVNVTVTGWAPVARFTADSVCLGNTTSFIDSSTVITPPPSTITSWYWDFGDGDTSVVQSPGHVYAASGVYQTSLTVLTNVGCQHTVTNPIIVYQPPTALFSPTTACTLTPYQFTDGSTAAPGDSISTWLWNFGDGFSASIKDPSHQYSIPGTYSPDLTVTTVNGCSSTFGSSINVVSSSLPPAPFSLLAPLHNFMFSAASINFSWNTSTNADHYQLLVAEDSLFNNNLQNFNNLTAPFYTGTFAMNRTYWWKVIAMDVCGATYTSGVRKFRTFSPTGIPGMKLWLKSDAGITQVGGIVTEWKDQSGYNNDAIQTLSSNRPAYKASVDSFNSLPAVYFNGSNKFLNGPTIPHIDSSSVTLFVVASGNSTSPGTYQGLFSVNTTAAGFNLARVVTSSSCLRFINKNQSLSSSNNSLPVSGFNPSILCVSKTYGAKAELFINGNIDGTSTNSNLSGPFTNDIYKIGCIGNGSYFKGNIAEIMLFNSVLPVSDRKSVETYFRYKYAPPVNLGPDINIAYGLCDTLLNAGPRFTSYLWSTGETTSSITAGSGTYWVSVTDIFGYVSKDTINVTKPSLHIPDTAFCIYSSAMVSSGFNTGYTSLWSDSTVTPVYTADSAGTFWVKVSDTLGCFAIDTFQVAVDSFAVQASLGPDRKLCQGNTIGLMSGAQQAVNYMWNTGSGSSLILINDPPGTTPVYWLSVTDHNGCAALDTVQLTINGVAAIPMFTSDTACFGMQSQFTDLSSVVSPYTIMGWQWDFGDSTSATITNPTHTFASYGLYYSTLTVTTDSGCVSSITKPVAVYSLPDVHFLPFTGCSGVPVPFADQSTDAFGGINSWSWNFGDPASGTADTSTLENPFHTYALPGNYPVILIASSAAGCADTVTANVEIRESPGIDFTWTQSCEGTPVFFTDLTTTTPWAPITDLLWDFGDGDSSAYDNPAHNYSGAGTYNVTLTVRALSGCRIRLTKQVTVHAIPDADFTVSDLCQGSPGLFTDASTISNDTINQWHWDFDTIGGSTSQNPYFVFQDTGLYNVALTVTSNAGCSQKTVQPVHVFPKPQASFTFAPEYGVPPLAVTFTNTSIGATSYFWDFGDGATDYSQNPQHTYTAEGIYTVLLIAGNSNNCSDTATAKVYVIPTTLDIAVIAVTADNDGEFLRFTATVKNLGSRGVDEIDLSAQLNKGSIIRETWNGKMMPGDAVTYNFNAQLMVPPGGSADYICINASVPGAQPDNQPGNNEQCLVLRDVFIVSEPYPDPVTDQVNVDVIIPYAEQVEILLYNGNGQKLGTAFSGKAQEGYNNFVIPTDFLSEGVYALKVVFRDKTEVRKFVKF